MGAADPVRLMALAEAIADGARIDWGAVDESADVADRELVTQLRLLAGVGDVHRAEPLDPPAQAAPPIPERWGPLEIRDRLGVGQFGTVFLAWDPRLEREVALKLLRPRLSDADQVFTAAVVNEGRLLARVRHPHVITVFGADEINGQVGIWMELVQGSTLEVVFRTHGAFSAAEAALVGVDLCSALSAVHRAGLVHRDIKAQNIMREAGGRLVLMDFGAGEDVATRVSEGRLIGTPAYMAPELMDGGQATPQSDIYSVGVLLFWLVTGVYPVPGRTAAEVQSAQARGERRRLHDERADVPSSFVSIVERALARDPAARYRTAGEFEEALRGFVSSKPATDTSAPGPAARNWRIYAAVVMLVAVVGAGLTLLPQLRSANSAASVGASAAPTIRSVAVLPFTNVRGDPDTNYFALGLGDLLVSRLGSIRALRVVGTTSAGAAFTDKSGDAAKSLSADGLVTGTIDRQADRLRVNIRLVRAGTQDLLWSESYDRPVDEAFALQGLIARDIAREIRVSLSDDERARLNDAYRPDPQAQDDYLRARVLMHRQERPALVEARRLLEHAVEIDPGYQLAFAALARCYISLEGVGALQPVDAADAARRAAQAALAIDDNAEAQLALGHVAFMFDWNWTAAEASFRRSLDLNPSLSEARNRFSKFLAAAGRTQEALEQARLGLQIDPLSLEMHEALAMALYYDRNYTEALRTLQSIGAIGEQSPTILGRIYGAMGDGPTANRYISAAYERSRNPALLAERGRLYGAAGNTTEAQRILRELQQVRSSGDSYLFPGDIAFVLISLGRNEEALGWLERAVDERASRVLWLRVDPRVDPVRNHPRFRALLRRIGP
jgi:serine/threonine protein kinase/tetratricopeptide (TPR) repeat protein